MHLPPPDTFSSYAPAGYDSLAESQLLMDMDMDDFDDSDGLDGLDLSDAGFDADDYRA